MMERKASRRGVTRLNSDPANHMVPEGILFLHCFKKWVMSVNRNLAVSLSRISRPQKWELPAVPGLLSWKWDGLKASWWEHVFSRSSRLFHAAKLKHHYRIFTGMDIINDALETAVSGRLKNNWIPVHVNVAPATLTITSKQVTNFTLTEPLIIFTRLICRFCVFDAFLTPGWGSAVRVQGALLVLHGCRKGCPHLCFHHGRGSQRFHLPHVLVWTQCCQSERGCAGRLHGEF